MSQIQPVPGPSQDAFNAVVEQIAKNAVSVSFVNNVSTNTEGRTKCYKHGDSVILNFAITVVVNTSGYTTVLTIPEGYRPSNYVYGVANRMKNNDADTCVFVVDSNGNLQANLNGASATVYTGSISWTI